MTRCHILRSRPTWTWPLVIHTHHWSRQIDHYHNLHLPHLRNIYLKIRLHHKRNAAVENHLRTRSKTRRYSTQNNNRSNQLHQFTHKEKSRTYIGISMQTNPIYFITTASHNSSTEPKYLTYSMKIMACIKFRTHKIESVIESIISSAPNRSLPLSTEMAHHFI